MHYYLVWARSSRYRGNEPLTYAARQKLAPGAIVRVPLQREQVLGFVSREVPKPTFPTKPVADALPLPSLPTQILELAVWLQQFYAASLGITTQQVLPADLSDKRLQDQETVVNLAFQANLTPMKEFQHNVVKNITKPDTYLLHGRTGSGKTRVYIELTKRTLAAGKSVLVLVPEIGLSSQAAAQFRQAFGDRVVVLHSQLTPVERQQAWLRILRNQRVADLGQAAPAGIPLIVLGPRSALFSPLRDIGLIVVDEAHETAYKQEQAPYYHALRVASQLAHLHQATLLIGTATPSVSDYFLAEERAKPILVMDQLATDHDHPPTDFTLIDLKDRAQFSRSRLLSTPLITAITAALQRHEQSLVYLNRRGTARVVLCENCGWQALCPRCDLPLVYHADNSTLRCHTCGYSENLRMTCPVCSHPSVLFKSFGTKALEAELHRLFPEAIIQRFDTDNKKSERFEQHYEAVRNGAVDILVGTQLLAKGLDLPQLSTLGIVLADSSLYLPDFSATERTYQLLTQVLGRIGRGHVQGHAIVQTYHPDSPLLAAAINGDWESFYRTELEERRTFHFPPFYHLLKLSVRRATPKSAEQAAEKVKNVLMSEIKDIQIDGPAPSFHEKLQGKYQYQLVVRSTNRSQLLAVIKRLPAGWTYDIDPVNLL